MDDYITDPQVGREGGISAPSCKYKAKCLATHELDHVPQRAKGSAFRDCVLQICSFTSILSHIMLVTYRPD